MITESNCECGCGQVIDPAVDPDPFFKGQACASLWMWSQRPGIARPDLWRANQRQLWVWRLCLATWRWDISYHFEPCRRAEMVKWHNGTPYCVIVARWRQGWERTWWPARLAEEVAVIPRRLPWKTQMEIALTYAFGGEDEILRRSRESALAA